MRMVVDILIGAVALLHIYFLVLEMFLWTKPFGLRTFAQTLKQAKASAVVAGNQGLYNGFLAAGLLWGLFSSNIEVARQIQEFFLACVIVAGAYGGATVAKKIFFVQALPALLAVVLLQII